MKKLIFLILVLLIIFAGFWAAFSNRDSALPQPEPQAANSFSECVEAGNPVLESYPRQCRDETGRLFVEDIGNLAEKQDLIRLDSLRPNDVVVSPLTITGEARGTWYFEASFPVRLEDANGNVLVQHYAEAQSEWMTENFVPFRTTLNFSPSQTTTGFLVLEKDNPSGLPEHADQLRIPVRFR